MNYSRDITVVFISTYYWFLWKCLANELGFLTSVVIQWATFWSLLTTTPKLSPIFFFQCGLPCARKCCKAIVLKLWWVSESPEEPSFLKRTGGLGLCIFTKLSYPLNLRITAVDYTYKFFSFFFFFYTSFSQIFLAIIFFKTPMKKVFKFTSLQKT